MFRLTFRPMLQRCASRQLEWPAHSRQLSTLLHRVASSHDDQSIGRTGQSYKLQIRLLHTSRPLCARTSFVRRVKDKIQRIRQDPNIQNKVMGVGAAGYGITKVGKMGFVAKYAFPALKLTKAGPLLSMGLTTVCYSFLFGLPFAVGIVGVLFSSNASRAAALRTYGCEVQPQMMIPFFGTFSSGSTDYTKSEEYVLAGKPFQRCLVLLAPVVGMFSFTSAVPLMFGVSIGSQCGLAVASTGYMMGMLSLVPIGDMTPGGQLLGFFSKNALLIGTSINFALLFVLSNPILYLCFFLNLYRVYQRGFYLFGRQFGGGDEEGNQFARGLTLSNFSDQQKAAVAAIYWSLFLMNAGGMYFVSQSLQKPQQIRQQQFQEEQQRRAREPYDFDPNRPTSLPDNTGGWGITDWAMGNLEAVEEMDRSEPLDWWEQAQREANASVPEQERFRFN